MPAYYMKEIWTPLKIVGIKFFKSEENTIFMKFHQKPRKRIF
ncbi:hypothetical protein QTG56_07880 [Rossellomorea sp. AcN35-11]|nr:hypothetical protein QTG56_07880 [Rossellomorea sp. AcN35-11]